MQTLDEIKDFTRSKNALNQMNILDLMQIDEKMKTLIYEIHMKNIIARGGIEFWRYSWYYGSLWIENEQENL